MTRAELELRARDAGRWAASDEGAKWAFRAMLVFTIVLFYIVGRHQWFTRDDWAYVLSLEGVLHSEGWQQWLLAPIEGHWLTIPILLFHFIRELFGLDSYWPFLIPTMLTHVGAVLLTRAFCRRLRVTAWTTTIVCSMLLVFGSGWDNIVFAIQICYNLSLVCFLAQLLLVDHDGPPDRRDYFGAALGVVSVMSSAFGPLFLAGTFTLLALRRRWAALAIAVVPQALAYGWWWVTWYTGGGAAELPGDRAQLPAYLARGVTATFEAMVAIPTLAGVAILGTLAVSLSRAVAWRARTSMLAMWVAVAAMFLVIGWGRLGFGIPTAASSRYLHMAAIVIAPAFALMIDQIARFAVEARWAARILLVLAVGVNAGALRTNASTWALAARAEKELFELVAGSPDLTAGLDPNLTPSDASPNVTLGSFPYLIAEGAFQPRPPATDEERQRVRVALGLAP